MTGRPPITALLSVYLSMLFHSRALSSCSCRSFHSTDRSPATKPVGESKRSWWCDDGWWRREREWHTHTRSDGTLCHAMPSSFALVPSTQTLHVSAMSAQLLSCFRPRAISAGLIRAEVLTTPRFLSLPLNLRACWNFLGSRCSQAAVRPQRRGICALG